VFALVLIAQHLFPSGAAAQKDSPQGASAAACPKAADVKQPHMLGLWRAEFEGQPAGATVLLEKNANYADSFSGQINRNGERAKVAGDVEDGEFTLEESADGVRITATWIGDVVEGSCGREIRGTWQASREKRASPFVLRKLAGP
jgi:hypothetical protein